LYSDIVRAQAKITNPVRDTETRLAAAAAICAAQGAKLTPQRRTVLRLILESTSPPTAYQLLDRLKQEQNSAVPPTIYRALDFLLENRLIHKIERLSAFVSCVDAGHHHAHAAQFLICQRCGAVAELEDHDVSSAIAQAAAAQNFAPAHAVIEIEGICAVCSAS
jgi:Fur family zinc uptake transcriptional regulator